MKNDLKPYGNSESLQSAFVRGMEEAINQGLDFNLTIHEALNDLLGTWAAQAFFSSTATSSTTPKAFAAVAKGAFPKQTFAVMLDMIIKRASAFLSLLSHGSVSQFQLLILMINQQVGSEPVEKKLTPLHDNRAEDELDKLVGHKTT
jgi:hypothetical protein